MMGRRSASLALAAALALGLATGATAQTYPSGPITIVTGFPAGAGTDIFARLLADPLGKALGTTVVTDNRSGAGGNVGSEFVAKAKADGQTLLLGTAGTHAINVSLYPKLNFDVQKDFAPISLLSDVPNILVVNDKFPAKTVAEFLALIRANPGKYNYASTGNGASTHLAGERFKQLAKVDIVHVPYRGTPPAMQALYSNEVCCMFHQSLTVVEPIKAGQLRPLGATTTKRIPAFPDVPTIAESGVPGYESSTWYGLFAPAGTPKPVVDRLNAEVVKIINEPAFNKRLIDMGLVPWTSTPAEFAKVIADDIVRWREIVVSSGAKLD
jgi:tripartite-type tricarboxylate transporter receptor subunit TctC